MTPEDDVATWEDWCAYVGPVAVQAAIDLALAAPPLTPRQHAELAVILRRHPNPAAHDAA